MKRTLLALALLISFSDLFAYSKYWVQFTDKNGTPFSTGNPSVYLSARSIQRRQNQNILVTQRDFPPNPSYVSQVLATGAVTLNYRSRWFNAISITTTDVNALNAINALPFVQSVTPVKRLKGDPRDEEVFFQNVSVERNGTVLQPQAYPYGPSQGQASQINADCLHNQGYHGEGMEIAVLDAGFLNIQNLVAFDSLFANNQILGTWDFVAGDANVFDDDAHGEMVLSCMGGFYPNQIVGTAPKAKYWLLRTEDAPSEYVIEEDNWVAGAEFADSVGADVINTSLGYTTFDDPSQNHTYNDMDGNTCVCSRAADFAEAVGIFVTCSAGNSGSSSWFYIGAPADADSVLTVGAVNLSGNLANFSSRGPTSDGRIKPDVVACGNGAVVADQSNGINTGANGTSFSSPIMCGGVTCLWQAHPNFTNRQLYQAIIQSADRFTTPDNNYGYGIPDLCLASLILSGSDPAHFTADNLVSVFPNPFSDEFYFTFYSGNDQQLKVELRDVEGRIIMDQLVNVDGNSFNTRRITEMDAVSSGMYILSVTSANKVFTSKVVKQ